MQAPAHFLLKGGVSISVTVEATNGGRALTVVNALAALAEAQAYLSPLRMSKESLSARETLSKYAPRPQLLQAA